MLWNTDLRSLIKRDTQQTTAEVKAASKNENRWIIKAIYLKSSKIGKFSPLKCTYPKCTKIHGNTMCNFKTVSTG